MIHVVATVDLAAGKRAEFLQIFHQLMPKVHAEQGCIEYAPSIDANTGIDAQYAVGPDRVVIIEKWDSVDALKAHITAPHMLAYREEVKDLVRSTELRVLQPA